METLNKKEVALPKKTKIILSVVIIAVFLVALYIADENIRATSQWKMLISVIEKAAVYSIVVASMNLLNGFTGLFSLGQAGFMLIGAYAYAVVCIPQEYKEANYRYYGEPLIGFSIPNDMMALFGGEGTLMGTIGYYIGMIIPIILAGAVTGLLAYLIGIPVLRLKSDYLAIATLGFAEIIRAIFQWDGVGLVTNGSNILKKYVTYENAVFPVIVAGICIALILLLINSSYGRAFKAIRDDEIAAEAMGINLFKHKELSFVISSFFAGIGGALLAMFQSSINSTPFNSALTYEFLLIVVIGGIGSITGSILASFLFVAFSEWWLRGLDSGEWLGIESALFRSGFRKVVFAVIIVLIVLFYAKGIMGDREFSWDGLINWFRTLPSRLKVMPENVKARKLARDEAKALKQAAHVQAKKDKIDIGEDVPGGMGLFTPLPVYDHVVVLKKEVE